MKQRLGGTGLFLWLPNRSRENAARTDENTPEGIRVPERGVSLARVEISADWEHKNTQPLDWVFGSI